MTAQTCLLAVGIGSCEAGPMIRAGNVKVPPAPGVADHARAATWPQSAKSQMANGARTNKWIWIR
jgi:hypothetical protein